MSWQKKLHSDQTSVTPETDIKKSLRRIRNVINHTHDLELDA
jgi:hypothetical protein